MVTVGCPKLKRFMIQNAIPSVVPNRHQVPFSAADSSFGVTWAQIWDFWGKPTYGKAMVSSETDGFTYIHGGVSLHIYLGCLRRRHRHDHQRQQRRPQLRNFHDSTCRDTSYNCFVTEKRMGKCGKRMGNIWLVTSIISAMYKWDKPTEWGLTITRVSPLNRAVGWSSKYQMRWVFSMEAKIVVTSAKKGPERAGKGVPKKKITANHLGYRLVLDWAKVTHSH